MILTKQEWDKFWDVLGDNWYHDDDDVPETVGDLKPEDTFEITCGVVCYQGHGGRTPFNGIIFDPDEPTSLVEAIQKWRKLQTVATLVIEVDKAYEGAVREALEGLNLKIKFLT